MMLTKIKLIDSLVIQTSKGPYTIHKHSPLYYDMLKCATEEELDKLKDIKYDTTYNFYLKDDNTPVIIEVGPEKIFDSSNKTLIGCFINKADIYDLYPEYFL